MFKSKYSELLARVNFPLYTLAFLSERHVLVAGGGGGAKTGILNVIEIYELTNVGSTCRAERVCHYETGNEAIMNCAVFNAGKYFILFAGLEGNCHVYKIRYEVANTDQTVKENGKTVKEGSNGISTLRKRNIASSGTENSNHKSSLAPHQLVFKIQPIESFQTDYSDDPFQKLVKFSPKAKLLVTGGTDGHIRFWKHPKMNKVFDIEAHTDDVDDLDICPNGKLVVTVSRDGHGKIWSSEDGNLITELTYSLPSESDKYIFRSCRFGIIEDSGDVALFCTLNPAVRRKPPLKSYLCKWNTNQFSLEKIVSTGNDMLSAMAISDNGHFLALGTQSGCIQIYIAFSLQCIHNFGSVHGIFVTSVQFLPSSEESLRITGGHESSVVSVSVDNHIIIHHIPHRASISSYTLIIFLVLTLILVFVLMDYLKL